MPVGAVALGHTDSRMVEKFYSHLQSDHVSTAIRAAVNQAGGRDPREVVPGGGVDLLDACCCANNSSKPLSTRQKFIGIGVAPGDLQCSPPFGLVHD